MLVEPEKLLERISKFQPKSLVYYELKKHKPWFNKGAQNY
jgi:hypothetical protein